MRTTHTPATVTPQPRTKWWVGVSVILALLLTGIASVRYSTHDTKPAALNAARDINKTPDDGGVLRAEQLKYRVVRSFPHDRRAFLQGLLWHDGYLYESTGLQGQSTLRRIDLPTGQVLQMRKLPPEIFGEGLALAGTRLIQISWQSQRAFVYDQATFRLLNEWSYQGEGWGLTYDGKQLIVSDGSDTLTFRDPETFVPVRKVKVTLDGRSLKQLNELEWIEGEVWANVWQTDLIVRINPQTGQVKSLLDLTGLLPPNLRTGREDVLNGIAYNEKEKRIFIGGKLWPRLFEIKVEPAQPVAPS